MLVDISKFVGQSYSSIVILAIVGIVLLICIFSCTSKGIIKDLFNLVYLVGLICMFVFLYPIGYQYLSAMGFIEGLQASASGVLATIVNMVSANLVYMIIIILAIIIVFVIVTKILNAIFKGLFKTKGKRGVKFFGFIYGLLFFVFISTVLLELISSPFVLKGGAQIINDSQYVAIYKQKVTDPLQEVFYEQNVVSNVDDFLIAKDASLSSVEQKQKAHGSFANVRLFLVNKADYISTLKTDSAYDTDKVKVAVRDMCYVVSTSKLSSDFINSKITNGLILEMSNWTSCFENADGSPVQVFSLGSEGRATLSNMISSISLEESIANRLNAIFSE